VLQPTDRMDFEDTTTVSVTIELAGGLCNSSLGEAEVWFTRQPECGTNFKAIKTIRGFSTQVKLPAHRFDFQFGALKSNLPTFNLAVLDYLTRANNATGELQMVNMSESTTGVRMRFEYHPLPTLGLTFSKMDKAPCAENQAPPFLRIASMMQTNATILVTEEYPSDLLPSVPTCTNVQGSINITNNLGEDAPSVPLLSVCRETCPQPVITDATTVSTYRNICVTNAPANTSVSLVCPDGGTIDTVYFVHFGANSTGQCSNSFVNTGCKATNAFLVVTRECIGKPNCTFALSASKFGASNCPNDYNMSFTSQVRCRIDTVVYERARVELPLQIGFPNRFGEYLKTFVLRMSVPGYFDDIVQVSVVRLCFA
jgi:hypothetical protein